MTDKERQAIDYAKIVAKRESIPLFDAFPEASARFGIPEKELRRKYEIYQLQIKLTKQAARVKKHQDSLK
jgi:G:T/U-mismatch repair DNA glycosylase